MSAKHKNTFKVGDVVVGRDYAGNVAAGIIVKICRSAPTNLIIQPLRAENQVVLNGQTALLASEALPAGPLPKRYSEGE